MVVLFLTEKPNRSALPSSLSFRVGLLELPPHLLETPLRKLHAEKTTSKPTPSASILNRGRPP